MNKEDYFKYYIQGSDHYLIPKDVFDELFDEMSNWREEVKELKKQIEDLQETIILLKASKPMLEYKKALEKNQQKEFVNYLENMLDDENDIFSVVRVKDVLSKYKKIIRSD